MAAVAGEWVVVEARVEAARGAARGRGVRAGLQPLEPPLVERDERVRVDAALARLLAQRRVLLDQVPRGAEARGLLLHLGAALVCARDTHARPRRWEAQPARLEASRLARARGSTVQGTEDWVVEINLASRCSSHVCGCFPSLLCVFVFFGPFLLPGVISSRMRHSPAKSVLSGAST